MARSKKNSDPDLTAKRQRVVLEEESDGPVKVVAYIRTDPDDEGLSASAQRSKIEFYCDDENFDLVDTFEDLGVGPDVSFEKRPGLSKAIHACAKEAATLVLVVSQDRVAVSALKGLFWEHMLDDRAGGRFKTVDGEYLQWGGDAAESAKALLAEFSAAQQAVDDAMAFGDEDGDWRIIEAAQNLALEKRNTNPVTGKPEKSKPSLRQVAEQLEIRGFVTRHGTRFSPAQVARMLEMKTPEMLNRKIQGDVSSGLDKRKPAGVA